MENDKKYLLKKIVLVASTILGYILVTGLVGYEVFTTINQVWPSFTNPGRWIYTIAFLITWSVISLIYFMFAYPPRGLLRHQVGRLHFG